MSASWIDRVKPRARQAGSSQWSPKSRWGLSTPAAVVAAAALVCSSGCGALGLYSLGHHLLSHHHVFKPIVSDDAVDPPAPADGVETSSQTPGSCGGQKGCPSR